MLNNNGWPTAIRIDGHAHIFSAHTIILAPAAIAAARYVSIPSQFRGGTIIINTSSVETPCYLPLADFLTSS